MPRGAVHGQRSGQSRLQQRQDPPPRRHLRRQRAANPTLSPPAGGKLRSNNAVSGPTAAAAALPRVLRERDYGALDKSQYNLFVQFFRQASPYIEGHRSRTFVLAIPGEVGRL